MRHDILQLVKALTTTDTKTLNEKVNKLFEEGGELAGKALPYERAAGTLHRIIRKDQVLEEVADVLLVALSIAYSLDYTDDDIASVMQRKSLVWSRLQENEAKVDPNKIPHEIHVTVSHVESVEHFKEVCHSIGVKPILLDLHTKSEGVVKDMMTSSVTVSSTSHAFTVMNDIADRLQRYGYTVVRRKIETVPWHPSAPSAANGLQHMEHNYFESHIEVVVNGPTHLSNLCAMLKPHGIHVSRNAFKSVGDSAFTVMATTRNYSDTREDFEERVRNARETLDRLGYETVGKDIIEYSIYDSKVHHDAAWTGD